MRKFREVLVDWLSILFVIALTLCLPVWGLITVTPMTGGWLGCGMAAGVIAAFWVWGMTVMGMDTYMESVMFFTLPLSLALCGFSLFCLGTLVWRGLEV